MNEVTEGEPTASHVATSESRPGRRGVSLRVYVLGLIALFVVVAGATDAYGRNLDVADSRDRATRDAQFAAGLAARAIATSIDAEKTTVAQTALNPGLSNAFTSPEARAGCSLQFAGDGPFGTGHLDLVDADGSVVCSSRPADAEPRYASADWLTTGSNATTVSDPVIDDRTGKLVVLVVAPIEGRGAVVGFLDLDALGPGLATMFGGPRGLEFVVTSPDKVLTRSIDPARWTGATLPGSTAASGDQAERPDLDGTTRLYGDAAVTPTAWQVHAGVDLAAALAPANGRGLHTLGLTLVGLATVLVAAFVLHRRIAQPIRDLSVGVRAAADHTDSDSIRVAGPKEIVRLGNDFRSLVATADRQLVTASRLAAIVESSADAIIGVTLDDAIASFNAAAEQIYGYAAAEVVGQKMSMLVVPEAERRHAEHLERVGRGDHIAEHEARGIRKDGCLVDLSITVSPVRNADGTIAGASYMARDITERKRAENQRRNLEARLHQAERLESLGQLAGGIAHDFNNLLSVIINYAALASDQLTDNDEIRADIDEIRYAGERAARLIRQLMIFGKRERVEAEIIDLNAIVANMHNLLVRSIGDHVELDVFLAENLPTTRLDRSQMEQILLNLVVNARDAMPTGGTLTIETAATDLDEDFSKLHPGLLPGPYLVLKVSDTGEGMSNEVLSRVFEPFFTTKPEGEGTGLGLATVYGIVTPAGGSVTIYSEVGVGTTFRIYLPVSDAVASTSAEQLADHARGNGETVLVVEDEPAIMDLTIRLLQRNGYSILSATNGAEALAVASHHDFQLLLTDSVMPRMSGQVLAAQIHGLRPELASLAVLYMSGYSRGVLGPQPGSREAEMLQKPFNEQTLLKAVADALATRPPAPLPRAGIPE